MDYESNLLTYIDMLDVGFSVYTDTAAPTSSISVATLPGSRTVQEYYNGVKDKEFLHEIQVKARDSERNRAIQALTDIGMALSDAEIPSSVDYGFNGIEVTNEVYFSEATTDGWIYFSLQIKSNLTI